MCLSGLGKGVQGKTRVSVSLTADVCGGREGSKMIAWVVFIGFRCRMGGVAGTQTHKKKTT